MSLKVFHLVFITAAIILALVCAAWGVIHFFSEGRNAWDLAFGLGSVAAAVGLVFYERYFLRKLKHVDYL
jgi:hypothetical protein